jgi:hypothetical protein
LTVELDAPDPRASAADRLLQHPVPHVIDCQLIECASHHVWAVRVYPELALNDDASAKDRQIIVLFLVLLHEPTAHRRDHGVEERTDERFE